MLKIFVMIKFCRQQMYILGETVEIQNSWWNVQGICKVTIRIIQLGFLPPVLGEGDKGEDLWVKVFNSQRTGMF